MDPPSHPRRRRPSQFSARLSRSLPDPRRHQLRLGRHPRCNPLRLQRRASPLILHLHRRIATPSPHRARTPSTPMVSGQVGRVDQRHHLGFPSHNLLLLVLAVLYTSGRSHGSGGFQLGHCGSRNRRHSGICVLLHGREAQIYTSRQLC